MDQKSQPDNNAGHLVIPALERAALKTKAKLLRQIADAYDPQERAPSSREAEATSTGTRKRRKPAKKQASSQPQNAKSPKA